MRGGRIFASPLLWVGALFMVLLFDMPALRPLFHWAFPEARPAIYNRSSFFSLFLSHLAIVALASAAASLVAITLAVFVTRPSGRDFRAIAEVLATVGQTFPPVAVLALTVPAVGFGAEPTVIALFLYGLLPILANAIAGLDGVPAAVREAARGMGLSPFQVLWRVELALAAPIILAGIRTSVTVSIGTATIGSVVGAVTFGTPIFDGLVVNKLPFVIEGAVLVGLFAIVTDMIFARLEARLRRRLPG
ncbi:MAG: ABC transporter permease [Stellaceae bacterium]